MIRVFFIMKVDYIIVGGGLAGLCFARFCELHQKTFAVYDGGLRSSSKIAGGMFNPVVLKRFTPIWKSEEQLRLAVSFYKELEADLGINFFHELPILRKFASIEEQNDWFTACDRPLLHPFLNEEIITDKIERINSKFGFGEVYASGFLDVPFFIRNYQEYLIKKNSFKAEKFDYNAVSVDKNRITYKAITSGDIIFAEGFSLHENPYFKDLPLDGTKGELLLVRIPGLKLGKIIKSGIFIIPYKGDLFKVGATYNWKDKTDYPTKEGQQELVKGLEDLLEGNDYEIIEHWAGVRPTVRDRRPLTGTHYQYKNVHLLNGLGTRGVLLGPFLAQALFMNIEYKQPLEYEVDISRYYKKMQLKK